MVESRVNTIPYCERHWTLEWLVMLTLTAGTVCILLVIPESWLYQFLLLSAGAVALMDGWLLNVFPQQCLDLWRQSLVNHLPDRASVISHEDHSDEKPTIEHSEDTKHKYKPIPVTRLAENPAYVKEMLMKSCSILETSGRALQVAENKSTLNEEMIATVVSCKKKHDPKDQINVNSVEDLDSIHEELLGVPLLLRVWAERQVQQDPMGGAPTEKWEGDLALLLDTSHPMIRPELERALEQARKILQSRGFFCLQIDLGPIIDRWIKAAYPRGCCTVGSIRSHKARLFITNFRKPEHCFDCNVIWCLLLGPCWLLSAPCYKMYRKFKCKDIKIIPEIQLVRRSILPSGKVVEITRLAAMDLFSVTKEETENWLNVVIQQEAYFTYCWLCNHRESTVSKAVYRELYNHFF